jgi:hypothetical protein
VKCATRVRASEYFLPNPSARGQWEGATERSGNHSVRPRQLPARLRPKSFALASEHIHQQRGESDQYARGHYQCRPPGRFGEFQDRAYVVDERQIIIFCRAGFFGSFEPAPNTRKLIQAKFVSLSAALGPAKLQVAHSRQVQPRKLSRTALPEALRGRHSADPRGWTMQQRLTPLLMRWQSRTRKKPDQLAAGPVKPSAL